MRTLVLILMIALLPLRMWAAEGMAVRMAQDQVAAAGLSAAEPMPQDCPMLAQAQAEPGSPDGAPTTAHCMTCHLCAAAACLSEVAVAQGPAPAGSPESRPSPYLSATLAPDLRPPIS